LTSVPRHATGRDAARQHELLFGLGQLLALSLRLAQGMPSPPGQQNLILGVGVPRRVPDSPDDVLKLTSRDLDPDPPVRAGPQLALSPDQTHPMTELPEPGVLPGALTEGREWRASMTDCLEGRFVPN